MIWHDDGYGITQTSLAFFRERRECIGSIVGVTMLADPSEDGGWTTYPFRIIGEDAEIWLSGCNSGYGGEGPHGSITILKELGYPEPYCNWPLDKAEFKLGSPYRPEIPLEPEPEVDMAGTEEILDIIKAYHQEHGQMPTIREIGERANIKSPEPVYRRLNALEVAGKIKREPYKARAIEILEVTE